MMELRAGYLQNLDIMMFDTRTVTPSILGQVANATGDLSLSASSDIERS